MPLWAWNAKAKRDTANLRLQSTCCQLSLTRLLVRIPNPPLNRAQISANAVGVVEALRAAGFDAYLVGGCVRDLLLGRPPKDFDVATDATPEDVREVLPRVRLVGRRFRIAHVRMRREVIEVSTFRRAQDGDDSLQGRNGHRAAHLSEQGILLRDNAYGAIDEDVLRRDFTVNALYYDPVDDCVLDYCSGMADVASRTLRTIGAPEQRFREDPVRMLRAVRFAAKLDLALHPATEAAIAPTREMLTAVPPARLFDEFIKLFMQGHGERTLELLRERRLVEVLFRLPPHGEAMARLALASTDQRIAAGLPVTPGFLWAAFLWQEYVDGLPKTGDGSSSDDQTACAVLQTQQSTIAVPRRHSYFARDVWRLQPRFEQRTQGNVAALLEHRRFRAAYDFLLLRAECGEVPTELGEWWTEAQGVNAEELTHDLPPEPKRRRRRRRGRRRAPTLGEGAA